VRIPLGTLPSKSTDGTNGEDRDVHPFFPGDNGLTHHIWYSQTMLSCPYSTGTLIRILVRQSGTLVVAVTLH